MGPESASLVVTHGIVLPHSPGGCRDSTSSSTDTSKGPSTSSNNSMGYIRHSSDRFYMLLQLSLRTISVEVTNGSEPVGSRAREASWTTKERMDKECMQLR